jgi:hypothetical protein
VHREEDRPARYLRIGAVEGELAALGIQTGEIKLLVNVVEAELVEVWVNRVKKVSVENRILIVIRHKVTCENIMTGTEGVIETADPLVLILGGRDRVGNETGCILSGCGRQVLHQSDGRGLYSDGLIVVLPVDGFATKPAELLSLAPVSAT